ncbi:MAG: alpha/beta fold hydrolase [Thermoanaerobaculaceae bacterium]|nr:alpha/beta fold hydrolase [Thermoanaerobaculaceae bacterium]MDI9620736.1 alpha/beta hydrolase [Acidobacteriota bacterium]NLH10086.1 alpha/beta fold hydrolase [Holophagae bacterium]HPW56809.1 alpha/beta hydrolase [Thermoanaerobaculaceae bacterium]
MQIEVGGVRLAVVVGGEGVPVVLLHGFPLSSAIWDPIRPSLESVCRLVTPDLRGMGRSERPAGSYSLEVLAEDVLRLVDALALERFVLGGHSMGGYVALRFAARWPERLAGLVFVGSKAEADPPPGRVVRQEAIAEIGRYGAERYLEGFVPRLVGRTTHQEHPELLPRLRAIVAGTPAHVLQGCQQAMLERPDSTSLLPTLDVPALVVVGEEDSFVPIATAQGMAAELPQGRLAVIPGAGHTPSMERPVLTASAFFSFVASLPVSSQSPALPNERPRSR